VEVYGARILIHRMMPHRECMAVTFLVAIVVTLAAAPSSKDPALQTKVEPEWDASLQSNYYTDIQSVRMTIDGGGVPFSVESSTGLAANVVDALSKWRYGTDHPFALELRVPIRHQLDDKAEMSLHRNWAAGSYVEVIKSGLALTEPEVVRIEEYLTAEASPKLLVWYANQPDEADSPRLRKRRTAAIAALVTQKPDSTFLTGPYATLNLDGELLGDTAGYEQIRTLWLVKIAEPVSSLHTFENAFNFLEVHDPETAQKMLDRDGPRFDHAAAIRLGDLWARAALGITAIDPLTGRASDASATPSSFGLSLKAALRNAIDPRIMASALWTITRDGRSLDKLGKLPESYSEVCSSLLTRWKAVFPPTAYSCDTKTTDSPTDRFEQASTRGGVSTPRLLHKVEPEYPARALQFHLNATNVYHVVVGADGKVTDIGLTQGILMFNSACLDALKKWRFQPGSLNGTPVPVVANIEVNFHSGRR
jgi:TonB family protein